MKRLLLLTCVTAFAACDKGTDGGLKIQVTIAPSVKTNCIALEVQKVGDGTLLASTVVARPVGDAPVGFAVRQGDLPTQVQVQAVGYSGAQCDDAATRKLASRGELKMVAFPNAGVDTVALALGPPEASLDADRDGVVGIAHGGIDCDDTNPNAYPGATQLCDSPIDLNCDGAVFCADSACSTSAVCMRPPDRLAFLSPAPVGMKRFNCSPAVVIESRDALGVAAVTRRVSLTLTGSLAGTEFFSDPACKVALPAPAIAYGQTQTTLYTKASSFGQQTLTLAATGLTGATQSFNVLPQDVAGLSFIPAVATTTAGDCTQLTLSTVDAEMRPTPSQTPLAVSLSASPSTGTEFYADSDTTCDTSLPTVIFSGGADTVKVRVRSDRSTTAIAPLEITADASTLTKATLALTVKAAVAAQLAFISQAPGLVVNACSGAVVKVGVRDRFGNETTVPTDTIVTLTSMRVTGISAALTYSLAGDCSNDQSMLQATIPANSNESVPVAIKGSAVGTLRMIASGPLGITPGTQLATIATGAPSSIHIISSQPTTLTAGVCSPAPVVIETQDSSNARSSVQGSALSIEVSGTGLSFFTEDTCTTALPANKLTIPVGSAEGRIYLRGATTNPGIDLAVVTNSYPLPNNEDHQIVIVKPGVPYSLHWVSTTSRTAASGVCAGAFTLELRDRSGNLTSFSTTQTVTVGGGVTASANAACGASTISFAAGASQVDVYTSALTAQVYAVTAVAGGVMSSAPPASLTVTPGPYAKLVYITPITFPRVVMAGTCLEVTVERRDAADNAVPVSGATLFTLETAASGVTTYATSAGCTAGTGALAGNALTVGSGATAPFWVRPTVVQATSVRVTSASLNTPSGDLTVVPAAAASLVWVAPAGGTASVPSGACVAAILERRDPFGNAAPDAAALNIPTALEGTSTTGGRVSSNSACGDTVTSLNIAGGASQVSFGMSSTTAGTLTVTFSSTLLNPTPANITVSPGNATQLVYTVSPGATQIVAGTCTQLTVERRDPSNNPVPFTGTFNIILPSGMTAYRNNANCAAVASPITSLMVTAGALGTFWVRPTLAGGNPVTINDGGSLSAMTSVVVRAATTFSINWSAGTPNGATAGVCTAITLERKDEFGNAASGTTLTITASASGSASGPAVFSNASDCSSAVAGPFAVGFTVTDVQRTFYVMTTLVGTLSMTPVGPPSTGQRDLTITPAAAAALFFTTTPTATTAGTCAANSVEARDVYGNRAAPGGAGLTVNLSTTAGAATFYASTASCPASPVTTATIAADGTAATFALRPTSVGTVTIQAAATGVSSATQNWSVSAGAPARLGWKTKPATLTRFACTLAEVQVEDAFGNLVNAPAAPPTRTLNIASSNATAGLWFSTASDCSTGPVSSISLAANAPSAALYVVAIGSGATDVTLTDATGGGLGTTPVATMTVAGAAGALVVAATNTNIEYFDCEPVTVTRQVAAANWVKGSTPLTVSSASATSISVHSDLNCTTAIGTPTIADGSAGITFYVRGRSGTGGVVITAADVNAGFADGTLGVTALPLVRRGSCTMPALPATAPQTVDCAIGSTIPSGTSHTFMVFQSIVDSANTRDATVRCRLKDASTIECQRVGALTAPAATIRWQTVSMGRGPSGSYAGGLTVQHFSKVETAAVFTIDVAISAVTRSRSFLLLSHAQDGAVFGNPDWMTAKFKDDTNVTLTAPTTFASAPFDYALQVVELDGITVDRGTGSATNAATFSLVGASLDLTRTFALSTTRFGGDGADLMCKRAFRVDLPNATDTRFSRRSNSATAACLTTDVSEASWERIQMPTGGTVRSCSIQIASGASNTCTVAAPALTTHRTLVLSAQQGPGGQASGETAFDTTDNFAYANATFDLGGTGNLTVTATRAASGAIRSDFTPMVIEFAP